MKSEEEIDCDTTDEPVCPYCGYNKGFEWGDEGNEASVPDQHWERECGECGKKYTVTNNVTFAFSTEKKPCANGEPHNMKYRYTDKQHKLILNQCEWCDHEEWKKEA